MSGYGWNVAAGGGAPVRISATYDNFLTANGGAATLRCFGGQQCGQAFIDWNGVGVEQWGDDLHGISAGGAGPAVVTSLRYGYINISPLLGTSTHTITIYDMVAPSAEHEAGLFDKGALLTSIVLPGNPTGAFTVTVTNLNIQLPNSAVWIKMAENPGTLGYPYTFWLNGGAGNGIGTSHPGVTYTVKDVPRYPYNEWAAIDVFYFAGIGYVASNLQIALSGFHVPAPVVMSLLGIAGLVTLRRRRH